MKPRCAVTPASEETARCFHKFCLIVALIHLGIAVGMAWFHGIAEYRHRDLG